MAEETSERKFDFVGVAGIVMIVCSILH
jgi:hypothetical protein